MPRDVKAVLGKILAAHRGLPEDAGPALLADLARSGRFQEECWG
jgi:sulfite reductase alpha subunit-like flavoprotein